MRWSLLASVLFCLGVQGRQCYFPDHSESGDVPCTDDTYTHCCSSTDLCLTNGYCYSVSHQPYVLSRASCTDQNWGSSCPQKCIGSDDNTSGGCSIINLLYVNGTSTYCCGTPVINSASDNITCPNGEQPFELGSADVIFGVARLANVSASSTVAVTSSTASATSTSSSTSTADSETCSSSDSDCNSKKIAIGAGVGVPLGVLALSALLWGFWERSQRHKSNQIQLMDVPQGEVQNGYAAVQQQQVYVPPAELHSRDVSELMGPQHKHN